MSNREELTNQANELGLEFKGNISNKKLVEIIAEAKGEPIPLDETAPEGPKIKESSEESGNSTVNSNSEAEVRRKFVASQKEKAFKTSVITLTNKDSRENGTVTTAYLSFENQNYGISKIVPLDVPVELEHSLIKIAEAVTITLHKDEVIKGVRTGNKVPVTVKKYAISYSK